MTTFSTDYLLKLYWEQVAEEPSFTIESILWMGFYHNKNGLGVYFRRGTYTIGHTLTTAITNVNAGLAPCNDFVESYGDTVFEPQILTNNFPQMCNDVKEFATAIGFPEVRWAGTGTDATFILGYPDDDPAPSWQAMEDTLYLTVSRTISRWQALFLDKVQLYNPHLGTQRTFTDESITNITLYQGEFGLESLCLNTTLDDNGLPTDDDDCWYLKVDIDLPTAIGPGEEAEEILVSALKNFFDEIMDRSFCDEESLYMWVMTQKLIHRVAARLEQERPFGTARIADNFRVFVQHHDTGDDMDMRLAAFARTHLSLSCADYMANFKIDEPID